MKRFDLARQLTAARRRIFEMINRRADAALTRTSIRPYYPRYGGRKEQTHG